MNFTVHKVKQFPSVNYLEKNLKENQNEISNKGRYNVRNYIQQNE